MKKILVTQRLCRHDEYDETYNRIDIRWAGILGEASLLPVLFPTGCPVGEFLDASGVSGILLTGGNDLATVSGDPLSVRRDRDEAAIIDNALSRHLPVMGVCRGMQIIARHFGEAVIKVAGHAGARHPITHSGASRYAEYLGAAGRVNSFHDYAVTGVAPPLAVSAISEDGAVEAIEHLSERIFGFMWHPEREEPFRSCDTAFLSRFFNSP
jgi:gamma-glutamyl-gamma-aminobutyrate hydrolase PuuD